MNVNDMYGRIGEYIGSHDSESYGQIAASLGLSRSQVSRIARRLGIRRGPGKRSTALIAAVAAIGAFGQKAQCAVAAQVAIPVDDAVTATPTPAPADAQALQ
jgi:hypothetical protein